ncbi:MAG: hypothetical protein EU532_04695 [Promethearchaeota archaeon]|nr:MAG: hypothetical protein EU532_04695 [Candidatus Lokiarchaeota archaeon]
MIRLTNLLPEWAEIIHNGIKHDEVETYRTIRHIFRSLWTYFTILNGKFESNIKNENIKSLQKDIEKISRFHKDIFPIILLYHDIGRPFNREWHTFESAKIIQKRKLLRNLNFTPMQQDILSGVVRHHLLPGTIFTGESSYFGAISLYNDKNLDPIWLSNQNIDMFFHILMVFTIIDIWGYDYSKIYDHYFSHYSQIRDNLTSIFGKIDSIELRDHKNYLYNKLSTLDAFNLKWRVACALRIFQFINTRPYLTEDFYYAKLYEALNNINQNWEDFSGSLGVEHSQIQFKYALPIMMVLASGNFARKPFDPKEKLLPGIFNFWNTCTNMIKISNEKPESYSNNTHVLWNFVFNLPRGWFFQSKHVRYILSNKFLTNIEKTKVEFNPEMDCYLVNIT